MCPFAPGNQYCWTDKYVKILPECPKIQISTESKQQICFSQSNTPMNEMQTEAVLNGDLETTDGRTQLSPASGIIGPRNPLNANGTRNAGIQHGKPELPA
jgi:hypothetical protein